MTTESNGAVTSDAAAPQLKSIDTSYRATLVVPDAKAEVTPAPAPEPTPQPAAAEAVPPEGAHDHAPDADSSPGKGNDKRLPRWMKERLERVRQVTAAETREQMLREFQQTPPATQPPAAEAPKAKTLEDFNFDQNAYTDYLVEEKLNKRERDRSQAEAQQKQAQAVESFKARVDAFEERAGDGAWDDIVSAPINTDPAYKPLTGLFMGSEHDLEIAHYLATNPKEAERLRDLPPLKQAMELGRLAEKFETASSPDVSTPPAAPTLPKRTTTAPPPPKTVSGAGKPSVDINDPGLSTEQRIAAWRKAGRR